MNNERIPGKVIIDMQNKGVELMTERAEWRNKAMEKVICSFKLLQGDNILTTVNIYKVEDFSKELTIDHLTKKACSAFAKSNYQDLVIKAKSEHDNLLVHILKHPVIVDDGIITLKEYVEEKCEHIVTAIHRRLEVTE